MPFVPGPVYLPLDGCQMQFCLVQVQDGCTAGCHPFFVCFHQGSRAGQVVVQLLHQGIVINQLDAQVPGFLQDFQPAHLHLEGGQFIQAGSFFCLQAAHRSQVERLGNAHVSPSAEVVGAPEIVEFDFRVGQQGLRTVGQPVLVQAGDGRLQVRIVPFDFFEGCFQRGLGVAGHREE